MIASTVSAALLLAGAAVAQKPEASGKGACVPLAELAAASPDLAELSLLADEAEFPLTGSDADLTIFAPVNEAILALGDDAIQSLLDDPVALRKVLEGHIAIDGALLAADLGDGQLLTTVAGSLLTVEVSEAGVVLQAANGGSSAAVVTADVRACNTVVHLIDAVLIAGDAMPRQFPTRKAAPVAVDFGGEYGGYGAYGGYGGYGAYGELLDGSAGAGLGRGADSNADGSVRLSGESDASMTAIIAGAAVAGVVAAVAGAAAVLYTRQQAAAAAAAGGVAGSVMV